MRQYGLYFVLFLLSLVCSDTILVAQPLLYKPDARNQDYTTALNFYQKETGTGSLLFSGKEFIEYDSHIQGNAFFSEDWTEGSLFYDSVLYIDVSMRYDVVADAVLVDQNNIAKSIQLESGKIDWFILLDHHFVKFITGGPVAAGFYDVLVDDKVKLLVRRRKVHKEAIDEIDRRVRNWFEAQDEFYVVKDGVFHKIRNTRGLTYLLSDHKKEVKKFIKRNPTRFSDNAEELLKQAIIYYNQL